MLRMRFYLTRSQLNSGVSQPPTLTDQRGPAHECWSSRSDRRRSCRCALRRRLSLEREAEAVRPRQRLILSGMQGEVERRAG